MKEKYIKYIYPLAREHWESYLYYIRYKTLEITPSQTPFQIFFQLSSYYKHRNIP